MYGKVKVNDNTVIKIRENEVIIRQYNEFDNTYNIIILSQNELKTIFYTIESTKDA